MTGQKIIGYAMRDGQPHPIYQVTGADGIQVTADDGDDDEPDDVDDDDRDTPPAPPRPRANGRQPAADGDWTPPTRDEWERQKAAIRRNNQENRKLRGLKTRLETLGVEDIDAWLEERGIDPTTGGKLGEAPPEGDGGPAQDQQQPAAIKTTSDATLARRLREAEKAQARTELKYKPALTRLATRAALHDAGWTGSDLTRVMKLIDMDEVDVNSDGEVEGLTEQVEELKAEFPEWFRGGKRRRAPATGDPDVDGNDGPPAPPRRRVPEGPGRGTQLVGGGDRRTDTEPVGWLARVNEQIG